MTRPQSISDVVGLNFLCTHSFAEYLQRISKIVSLILTPGCMAALVSNNDGGIPLEEFPLGFDTGGHYSLHYFISLFCVCDFCDFCDICFSLGLSNSGIDHLISSLCNQFHIVSDQDINQIATVLKMLYLSDFRELQNDLNALIVLGQGITAKP